MATETTIAVQVASSTAVLRVFSQDSNTVLDREKIDEGELDEEAKACSTS
jgi:hypothetical protein